MGAAGARTLGRSSYHLPVEGLAALSYLAFQAHSGLETFTTKVLLALPLLLSAIREMQRETFRAKNARRSKRGGNSGSRSDGTHLACRLDIERRDPLAFLLPQALKKRRRSAIFFIASDVAEDSSPQRDFNTIDLEGGGLGGGVRVQSPEEGKDLINAEARWPPACRSTLRDPWVVSPLGLAW